VASSAHVYIAVRVNIYVGVPARQAPYSMRSKKTSSATSRRHVPVHPTLEAVPSYYLHR